MTEKCAFSVNYPAATVVPIKSAQRNKRGKLVKIRIFFKKVNFWPRNLVCDKEILNGNLESLFDLLVGHPSLQSILAWQGQLNLATKKTYYQYTSPLGYFSRADEIFCALP